MTDTITSAFQARKAFDLEAPGGVERLLDFHRGFFGAATMQVEESGGDGGQGEGGQSDSAAASTDGGAGGQREQDGDERLGEGGMRALAAEREANRALRAAQQELEQRLRAFEDRDKTAEQKQAERLTELEQKAATAERSVEEKDALLLRYRVAAEKGLDLTAAERLRGATQDEVAADADAWIATWGKGPAGASGEQRRHVPDPGQGPRESTPEDPFEAGRARAKARFGDNSTT